MQSLPLYIGAPERKKEKERKEKRDLGNVIESGEFDSGPPAPSKSQPLSLSFFLFLLCLAFWFWIVSLLAPSFLSNLLSKKSTAAATGGLIFLVFYMRERVWQGY